MVISFDNPKHENLVNDFNALSKKYDKRGSDYALKILMTIDVLKAANSLYDVPHSFRPHPLQGQYKGFFAIDVDKTHRVIFKPDHDGDKDYRIDKFQTIKQIIILEIFKDYH